ncbi:MAG TPA: lipopolysaccharide heptosyltransferase II [Gemmatimonadales bacterium]|nr:lipopolysaccharide heptosyltransferase II [Gemmatimonadales bacterium]
MTESLAPDVLVVRFSAIGDILLTTPLLRAIRTRHPGARIAVLTKEPYVPLLSHNPHVSEVLAIAPDEGILAIAERIRAVRYSHLLDLHGNLRSHALRRLAPGAWSSYDKRTLQRALLITAKRDRYGAYLPIAERYFEAAMGLEVVPDGGPPDFFLSEAADCRAAERLVALELGRERPVVAIAPGAAHATKRWPVEYWVHLVGRITQTGADVAVLGGTDDVEAAAAITRAAGGASVASLAGALGLQETGAVIRRAEVLISGDTGVMHMATGVGTPVVALFGPTVRQFGFFPYRSPASVVELQLPCRPCSAHGSRRCPLGHHRCMRQLVPDLVFPALAEVLG